MSEFTGNELPGRNLESLTMNTRNIWICSRTGGNGGQICTMPCLHFDADHICKPKDRLGIRYTILGPVWLSKSRLQRLVGPALLPGSFIKIPLLYQTEHGMCSRELVVEKEEIPKLFPDAISAARRLDMVFCEPDRPHLTRRLEEESSTNERGVSGPRTPGYSSKSSLSIGRCLHLQGSDRGRRYESL